MIWFLSIYFEHYRYLTVLTNKNIVTSFLLVSRYGVAIFSFEMLMTFTIIPVLWFECWRSTWRAVAILIAINHLHLFESLSFIWWVFWLSFVWKKNELVVVEASEALSSNSSGYWAYKFARKRKSVKKITNAGTVWNVYSSAKYRFWLLFENAKMIYSPYFIAYNIKNDFKTSTLFKF